MNPLESFHRWRLTHGWKAEVRQRLNYILERINEMAETVATLNEKLDKLTETQAAERQEWLDLLKGFKDEIKRLSDLVAAGGVATQADLDALGGRIDAAVTATQGIVDAADAA